ECPRGSGPGDYDCPVHDDGFAAPRQAAEMELAESAGGGVGTSETRSRLSQALRRCRTKRSGPRSSEAWRNWTAVSMLMGEQFTAELLAGIMTGIATVAPNESLCPQN